MVLLAYLRMVGVVAVLLLAFPLLVAGQDNSPWFELADLRAMQVNEPQRLEGVLQAMYETVFYAQSAVEGQVSCQSPRPMAGRELLELIEAEIDQPSHGWAGPYRNNDHVAFILINALKARELCR